MLIETRDGLTLAYDEYIADEALRACSVAAPWTIPAAMVAIARAMVGRSTVPKRRHMAGAVGALRWALESSGLMAAARSENAADEAMARAADVERHLVIARREWGLALQPPQQGEVGT